MSIPRTRRSRTFFPLILAGSLAALPCRASAQEDDGTDSGADTGSVGDDDSIAHTPDNADIKLHQQLGISGTIVGLVFLSLGVMQLRGRQVNRWLAAVVAVTLAILWGVGGHMGGRASWGPDTFPAYEHLTTPDAGAQ